MNPAAYEELFDLLTQSELDDRLQDLVLAAADGPEGLAGRLGGGATAAPHTPGAVGATAPPPVTYLEEIAVEGFRGIGKRSRLQLSPSPGLTLVVGRNGSGKSSFAEGLEVLLTGTTWRWEERTKVWRDGWRNLHHDGTATVSARFRTDGSAQPLQVTRSWPPGAQIVAEQAPEVSGSAASWAELDWDAALEQFRPLLSYTELGTMFSSRASRLYDALSAILGLEEFDAVLATLRDERLAREKTGKQERVDRLALRARLGESADPRAAAIDSLLASRSPDLEAVSAAAGAHESVANPALRAMMRIDIPQPESISVAVEELGAAFAEVNMLRLTDATGIDALAELLETGLRYHRDHVRADPADCPLCGATNALDTMWAVRADAAAQELRNQSRELRTAEDRLRRARATVASLFDASLRTTLAGAEDSEVDLADAVTALEDWFTAAGAGQSVEQATLLDAGRLLCDELTAVRDAAQAADEELAVAWRPVQEATLAWVALARRAAEDRVFVDRLKQAEMWMANALAALRAKRLAPVVEGARANWNLLRHESNVALGTVALTGKGNQRYANFDVAIDGSQASAFGVMSQGELSALAISIFLPRALLPGSPFGFVVIDDPVQSMDPAKVDGLARVLASAAAERQVIVFTHDERLPEAIRRLDIPARVMRVQRRAESHLEVVDAPPPSERYLAEAFALSQGENLPAQVRNAVIPSFCRSAIEAACAERIRRQRLLAGVSYAEVDAELAALTSLRTWLAAALGFSTAQGQALTDAVRKIGGPGAVQAVDLARRGAHEPIPGLDIEALTKDTRALVRALEKP